MRLAVPPAPWPPQGMPHCSIEGWCLGLADLGYFPPAKSWRRRCIGKIAFASALSDQVELPDRKEFAPIQKLGACPCRKSGSTFPGHALGVSRPARRGLTVSVKVKLVDHMSKYRLATGGRHRRRARYGCERSRHASQHRPGGTIGIAASGPKVAADFYNEQCIFKNLAHDASLRSRASCALGR
jgi:hypothetical protein